MRNFAAAFGIVCGVLFLYGFWAGERGDRMRISTANAPTQLTVIITLPDVTSRYRWLSVYGCSAEMTESGTFCTGDFERESTVPVDDRRTQQPPIYWRNLPGGTMQITAMAFDFDNKTLAQRTVTVFRGR